MRFEEFRNKLENFSLYAEGWRSYIYVGLWREEKVSVKVAKSKNVVKAIQREADILEYLKGLEGFPYILFRGDDFFVYRFIEGTPYGRLGASGEEEKRILRKVLELAFILDEKGINRDEFSRIDKNVIVSEDGGVYILDFERGGFSKRPSNVTQFLQLLRRKGFLTHKESIELGKMYGKGKEEVFKRIMAKLE